ncbi:MAG: hypothetical protein LUQ38_01790 [Methanotrichaceae archaeon]|nr:hypothetical protein [Methanotrichaceae archaeon]
MNHFSLRPYYINSESEDKQFNLESSPRGFSNLVAITYDLWNDVIDEVIRIHTPLFEAMRRAERYLILSRALVDELKIKGFKEVQEGEWNFLLIIEPYEDEIGGFKIYLLAAETSEVFQQAKVDAAMSQSASADDLRGFEVEHGLDLDDEIFEAMEDSYDISAEVTTNGMLFELVVFDSDDIDDSGKGAESWS